jgi:hypothetical protein
MCFKLPKTLFLLELKININVFYLVQLASHITIKMNKLVMINIILIQANSSVVMNLLVLNNIIMKMIVIMEIVSKEKINYM